MTRPHMRFVTCTVIYLALASLLAGCGVGKQASDVRAARTDQTPSYHCTGPSCASRVDRALVREPAWVVARDVRALRRDSYTADRHITVIMPDRTLLLIFHSVCTGSADGHCQSIDVFRNTKPKPIWHKQYAGVLQLRAQQSGFTVKSVSYGPQDPLCCPSLPPVSDTYTWTGHGLRQSGALSRSPTG